MTYNVYMLKQSFDITQRLNEMWTHSVYSKRILFPSTSCSWNMEITATEELASCYVDVAQIRPVEKYFSKKSIFFTIQFFSPQSC